MLQLRNFPMAHRMRRVSQVKCVFFTFLVKALNKVVKEDIKFQSMERQAAEVKMLLRDQS